MRPTILALGGHDPSGGAGLQADIETIAALGGRAITLPTALTLQDSQQVVGFEPLSPELLMRQATLLLEDFRVDVIKIGMVGSVGMCDQIHTLLQRHPTLPVVLDPVLSGGNGGPLSTENLAESIRQQLIPLTTVATPNRGELQQLAPSSDSLDYAAHQLQQLGCRNLLVTGTDEPRADEAVDQVHHQLYLEGGAVRQFHNRRLPHHYHGSGCTLSSAIATQLALQLPVEQAVAEALDFTWNSLLHADQPGSGQYLPNRFYQ